MLRLAAQKTFVRLPEFQARRLVADRGIVNHSRYRARPGKRFQEAVFGIVPEALTQPHRLARHRLSAGQAAPGPSLSSPSLDQKVNRACSPRSGNPGRRGCNPCAAPRLWCSRPPRFRCLASTGICRIAAHVLLSRVRAPNFLPPSLCC